MKSEAHATLVACSLGLIACTGAIDGPDEQGRPGGRPHAPEVTDPVRPDIGTMIPGAPRNGPPSTNGMPSPAGARPTGPQPVAHLHRLTARQFSNSVQDLLGQEIPASALEPDQESEGLYAVGASALAVSPTGVARYEAALGLAMERALSDVARTTRLLSCMPQTPSDTACATRAINTLGRRAFRRPLTTAETARWVGVWQAIAAESGSSPLIGMRYALAGMLQSPNFLYRVELGAPSAVDGGRLKYGGFEMASRLASALWSSVPDDLLLDAAAQDGLSTADGVRRQAQRLMAHASARRAWREYIEDLYGLEHLDEAIKDTSVFRSWTATLRNAMREDLVRRVDDVVFAAPTDVLSLYDGKVAFVNNELARLYGVPTVTPDAARRIELPEESPRRGLTGSGAILAAYALPQRTSPTARGKFVAEVLLCKTVPLPPPGVDATLGPVDANASAREQLERHRISPSCAGCHALMDPIGLGLENFDGMGAYRTTERGRAIDASGSLDGASFKNAAELSVRLREHADAASCFARKLYTHAQGRMTLAVDEPAIDALARQFVTGGRRADRLLVDLVSSEAYRFVEPLAP